MLFQLGGANLLVKTVGMYGLLLGLSVHAADYPMVVSATHDPESVSQMYYHYGMPFVFPSQHIAMEGAEKVTTLLCYGREQGWDHLTTLSYLVTHISPEEFSAYRLSVGSVTLAAKSLTELQGD